MLDRTVSLSDGMGRCGTCCNYRETRSACIIADCYVSCSDIGNHGRDEKWRNPFRSLSHQLRAFPFLSCKAADSGSDIHSVSHRIDVSVFGSIQSCLTHSLPCRSDCEYGEPVLLSCKRCLYFIISRIEILDFTGNLHWKVVSRDGCDIINTTYSVKKVLPICLDIISDRGYRTCASHNYSSVHIFFTRKYYSNLFVIRSLITFSAPRIRSSTIAAAGSMRLTIPAHSPAI